MTSRPEKKTGMLDTPADHTNSWVDSIKRFFGLYLESISSGAFVLSYTAVSILGKLYGGFAKFFGFMESRRCDLVRSVLRVSLEDTCILQN